MKKYVLLLVFTCSSVLSIAQDIVFRSSTDSILAQVLSLNTEKVTLKLWDNLDGPTYYIPINDVVAIRYANGTLYTKEGNTKTPQKSKGTFFVGGTGVLGYSNAINFAVEPLVGYEFSDRWAAGLGIGIVMVANVDYLTVMGVVEPFARFCAWHNDVIYLDVKAVSGIGFDNVLELFQLGARPSLRFRINENFDLAADISLFGLQYRSDTGWTPMLGIDGASAGLWVAYRF